MEIRNATVEDARDLAYLFNLAGDGIPEYLWTGMIEGDELPLDVGARRACREDVDFSYAHARMCADGNTVLGMIVSYRQPDPYEIGDPSEYPDVVRPLIELESRAPGSWYINAVATYEKHRGMGVGKNLMADADASARAAGCECMSLIVASENGGAKKLYERLGFHVADSLPVIRYPGCLHGGNWSLMIKSPGSA